MNIRMGIVRILVNQQARRLLKNPAAIMLLVLTVSIALLVSTGGFFKPQPGPSQSDTRYWLIYDVDGPWIEHLREHAPETPRLRFLERDSVQFPLPRSVEAIEVQMSPTEDSEQSRILYHTSSADLTSLGSLPSWLWREAAAHYGEIEFLEETVAATKSGKPTGASTLENTKLSELLTPGMVAVMLIFSVQFFTCTHMLVSLAGQDRERGTSLALALTPATLEEILVARMAFHLLVAMVVSAMIVIILAPQAILSSLMWAVLLTGSIGFVAVGTVISSMARSQGTAGLTVVCYMLFGAFVFYLAARFPAVAMARQASFEHYGFPLLIHSIRGGSWSLIAAQLFARMAILVAIWFAASVSCFRRIGWQ